MSNALLRTILCVLVTANLADVALSGKEPVYSKETHIRIQNFANSDIVNTIVTAVDSFDWENGKGPKGNFQGVHIKRTEAVDRREEVNPDASNCPFTMALIFADGTEDQFRVYQKYAIGEADAHFQHLKGSRTLKYERVGGNTLQITVI